MLILKAPSLTLLMEYCMLLLPVKLPEGDDYAVNIELHACLHLLQHCSYTCRPFACDTACRQAAWTSCFIMAIIGTAIGAVPSLAAVLYRNWYVVQSIVVAALVYGALQAYSQSKEAGTGEGAGVAAVAPTAAAEPQ